MSLRYFLTFEFYSSFNLCEIYFTLTLQVFDHDSMPLDIKSYSAHDEVLFKFKILAYSNTQKIIFSIE